MHFGGKKMNKIERTTNQKRKNNKLLTNTVIRFNYREDSRESRERERERALGITEKQLQLTGLPKTSNQVSLLTQ